MARSDTVQALVDRFVQDVLQLIERARAERRAMLLGTVRSMLAEDREKRPDAQKAAPRKGPGRPLSEPKAAPSRAAKAAPSRTGSQPAPAVTTPPRATVRPAARGTSAPPVRRIGNVHPRVVAVPVQVQPPPPPPPDERQLELPWSPSSAVAPEPEPSPVAEPRGPQTEAAVLEAVRVLVRPTNAELAKHTGLPNATVYVALRALIEAGKVAKMETARGLEYSLVSSGDIRPFKRKARPQSDSSNVAPKDTPDEPPSSSN